MSQNRLSPERLSPEPVTASPGSPKILDSPEQPDDHELVDLILTQRQPERQDLEPEIQGQNSETFTQPGESDNALQNPAAPDPADGEQRVPEVSNENSNHSSSSTRENVREIIDERPRYIIIGRDDRDSEDSNISNPVSNQTENSNSDSNHTEDSNPLSGLEDSNQSAPDSHARNPSGGDDEPPAKIKKVSSPQKHEDLDGETCPICLVSWGNYGSHRLVALKCGHLFGFECVERWLKAQPAKDKSCPTCKSKATLKDLRFIYARRLVAADTSQITMLQMQVDILQIEKSKTELELQIMKNA